VSGLCFCCASLDRGVEQPVLTLQRGVNTFGSAAPSPPSAEHKLPSQRKFMLPVPTESDWYMGLHLVVHGFSCNQVKINQIGCVLWLPKLCK